MRVWVVYFRGEAEYATTDYYDAQARAFDLHNWYGDEIDIRKERVDWGIGDGRF